MRRKRLLYVPGLISLLLLPWVLIAFWPEVRMPPVSLRLFIPSDDSTQAPDMIKYSKYTVHQALQKKQIIKVYLWDDLNSSLCSHHNTKLNFVEQEIARLQYTNDTIHVLQIELGDDNTYDDFVYLINLAILYHVKRYAWLDNSFYIFANDPPHPPVTLDYLPYQVTVTVDNPPSGWDNFIGHVRFYIAETGFVLKHNYLILSGFVLLILVPGIIRLTKKQR